MIISANLNMSTVPVNNIYFPFAFAGAIQLMLT